MYKFRKHRLIHHEAFPVNGLLTGHSAAIEETVNPGYRFKIKGTAYLALILTRSGVSDYRINGAPVRIEPGSLLILPPGISFSEHVLGPDPCHNIYLMLEGKLAENLSNLLAPQRSFQYWSIVPAKVDRAIESTVRGIHRDPIQQPFQIAADLMELSVELHEVMRRTPGGRRLANRLERLIEADPVAQWSVREMAAELGMSESSFAHTFSREVGQAPAAFVRKVRCQLARTFLEEGLSVAETAERLGFSNPFHFSRVFKSATGVAPSTLKQGRVGSHRHS